MSDMRGLRLWGTLAFPRSMTWVERLAVRVLAVRWHIEIDVELDGADQVGEPG